MKLRYRLSPLGWTGAVILGGAFPTTMGALASAGPHAPGMAWAAAFLGALDVLGLLFIVIGIEVYAD